MSKPKGTQFKILSGALSVVAAMGSQRALTAGWRRLTHEEPPESADPTVPAAKAFGWIIANAVVAAGVALAVNRFAARHTGFAENEIDA